MDSLALLADLYRATPRQGPGGKAETLQALALTGFGTDRPLRVADIGCGTGASTRVLAAELDAHITAIDLLPAFIDELARRARQEGIHDRINPVIGDMASLPFGRESLDLIWSEGAIYNLGFSRGVRHWRNVLRPGGVLAVSEITWLTGARPAAVEQFWTSTYPEIDTAPRKLAVLEQAGFTPLGYFPLGDACWVENFYAPLAAGFEAFLARHDHSEAARLLVDEHRREMALYEANHSWYSYGFYIAQRTEK